MYNKNECISSCCVITFELLMTVIWADLAGTGYDTPLPLQNPSPRKIQTNSEIHIKKLPNIHWEKWKDPYEKDNRIVASITHFFFTRWRDG